MRYRKLRIAWSVAWGIACVLLIVLWARSYWWIDVADCRGQKFVSILGTLSIARKIDRYGIIDVKVPTPLRYFWGDSELTNEATIELKRKHVTLPYWSIAAVSVLVAATPWFRWRFTIRTLLVATALVAVVLALVVYGGGR